jgi:hypothetical protein
VHLAAAAVGGTFHSLTPARILDTRSSTPIGAAKTLDLLVAGQGGVPTTGVSAVVLNVTVTNPSAAGYLIVFPAGVAMPLASNLNFVAGQTVPNLVTVGLGTGGKVTIYNGYGSVDVVVDVAGYYSDPASSPGPDGLFNPLVPSRLLDTRSGNGAPAAKLSPGQTLNLQVTGRGGVPLTGVAAVVMNVTVTRPSSAGYLTVWPAGGATPLASNLNFVAGETVPNRVMVGIGTGGQVSIFNGLGFTDVVADVNGWFTDATVGGTGSRFTPVTPARILDSRVGTGGVTVPWGPNSGHPIGVAGLAGVPNMTDPNPPTAVVANVTVTNTTAPSALIAWPDSAAQPLASDLNWMGGVTVPNLAVIQVGPTGKVDLYNLFGCVDTIVDVVGWFTGPIPSITAAPPPMSSPCPSSPGAGWLARFNYYRATAGLPPVTSNAAWSDGDYKHSVYMVKTGDVAHSENPASPYYTPEGNAAAGASNIEVNSTVNFTDSQAIDFWMEAPFHAMGMMDPRLTQTGFGSYRDPSSSPWELGLALNVLSGNSFTGGTYPVYWPGNNMTVPLTSYGGGEFPDPLSACPGYSAPSGLPVFIQVGGNVATTTTAHSFTGNGTPLAHCILDSNNHPAGSDLTGRGGVIVIPQQPLQQGVRYVVALTVNGMPYTWSFQVG